MKVLVLRAAAAALVLALGIAIGAGPLQEDHDRRARALAAQQEQVADLERRIAELDRAAEFGAAYQEGTAERLLSGVLSRRTVALVALPGAAPETVAAFRTLIGVAGGQITADVAIADPLAEPEQRQLVEALTSQMAEQEELVIPAGFSGYERFGFLLARAIGVPPTVRSSEAPYDETGLGIVSGFQTADLLGAAGAVTRRAVLTLVVAGSEHDDSGRADALAAVVRAYADRARVVVAGPGASAEEAGVLGLLRGSGARPGVLSTVDSVDLPGGRIAAVLALAVRVRGTVGSYGGVDAEDGAVPPIG